MPDENSPKKIGILYIHGAGLAEDQTKLVGDPLATVADGFIDHFQKDPFLRDRYRVAARACTVENCGTEELELDVFAGDATRPTWVIHMREVLWKPLAPKLSLSTYLPLIWLWVFAFQSNFQRAQVLGEFLRQKRQRNKAMPKLNEFYDERRPTMHRWQMWSQIVLAISGLLASFCVWVAGEVYKPQNMIQLKLDWLTTDQVVSTILTTSLVAALLLIVLAIQERQDKKAGQNYPGSKKKASSHAQPNASGVDTGIDHPRAHRSLQLVLTALCTAWLSAFLLPILLVVYYVDRIAKWVIELVLLGTLIGVAVGDWPWVIRIGLVIIIVLAMWIMTRQVWAIPDELGTRFRRNIQLGLVNFITTLLVTGGAPWVILLISLLEWLSFLPLIGDNLKQLAKSISELGVWQALKDIYVILTDSSRSAVVRHLVEGAIQKLDQDHDLDAVHIFSHSLGTVVAYDTLVQIGRGNGVFIKKLARDPASLYNQIKTLVTFGSPLNKVRTLSYLQGLDAMAGFDNDRFGQNARLSSDLGDKAFRWINFYSPHDFVSDACVAFSDQELAEWVCPRDFTTWSANDIATAHGVYWTDVGFWNTALERMGIIYTGEGEKLLRLEEMAETDLRCCIMPLFDRIPTQAQVKSDSVESAQDALAELTQPELINRLRELGITTKIQLTTQVCLAPPTVMLKGLGLVKQSRFGARRLQL